MPHKTKAVPLHHVFLDNDNPRHDKIDNEGSIIHRLVMMEGVKPLAADIAGWGLSPLERMAVIPHPTQKNRYMTAEGNRRLCALKLLKDPEKAPTEPTRRAFRELRKALRVPIGDLDVVSFDSREEARHWLELRHEGPQGGKGAKPWNASQKARFNSAGNKDNPNVLALKILDYAVSRGLITQGERDGLSLTTLTRFLNSPLVRDSLGLTSNRDLATRASQDEFDRAARRFLQDALQPEKSGVHSRTSKDQRQAYAQKLRDAGVTPAPVASEPVTLNPKATGGARATDKSRRENRSPRNRAHVIPPEFRARIEDKILKRVYDELRGIDAAEYPFAASYLFRAFVEITTKRYCKKYGLPFAKGALHAAIGKVAEHLKGQGITDDVTKPLRVMANDEDASFSPDSIGNTLHGGGVANRRHLNDGWDSIEAGITEMLQRL